MSVKVYMNGQRVGKSLNVSPTGRLSNQTDFLRQVCASERAMQCLRRTTIADAILAGYRVDEYQDELVMTPDPSLVNADYSALERRLLHDPNGMWFDEISEIDPAAWGRLIQTALFKKLYGG